MKENYSGTDHENRRKIIDSVNPRITMMGDATNYTNPITGRAYVPEDNLELEIKGLYSGIIHIHSTGLIECQKALAGMDVREGKLGIFEYGRFLDTLSKLILNYREAELDLSSITDASGLDNALTSIDKKANKGGWNWFKDIQEREERETIMMIKNKEPRYYNPLNEYEYVKNIRKN